jgi:hypothetical protein
MVLALTEAVGRSVHPAEVAANRYMRLGGVRLNKDEKNLSEVANWVAMK